MSGDCAAWRALYWEYCGGGGRQLFLFPLVTDVGGLCYNQGHRHLLHVFVFSLQPRQNENGSLSLTVACRSQKSGGQSRDSSWRVGVDGQ